MAGPTEFFFFFTVTCQVFFLITNFEMLMNSHGNNEQRDHKGTEGVSGKGSVGSIIIASEFQRLAHKNPVFVQIILKTRYV